MKSEAKIVILVPTESEIGVFRRRMPQADVCLTGVGPYRCAAVTAAVLACPQGRTMARRVVKRGKRMVQQKVMPLVSR